MRFFMREEFWGQICKSKKGTSKLTPSHAFYLGSIRSVMQKYLEDRGEVTFDKIFSQKIGKLDIFVPSSCELVRSEGNNGVRLRDICRAVGSLLGRYIISLLFRLPTSDLERVSGPFISYMWGRGMIGVVSFITASENNMCLRSSLLSFSCKNHSGYFHSFG